MNAYKQQAVIIFLDFIFSFRGIFIFSPIIFLLGFGEYLDSRNPIFKQESVGQNKVPFLLYKFRSMAINTQSIATHLVDSSLGTKCG